jgi:hypothetical protein
MLDHGVAPEVCKIVRSKHSQYVVEQGETKIIELREEKFLTGLDGKLGRDVKFMAFLSRVR